MKKTIILTALVAFLFGTINTISAQDDSPRQEFMARQTERLVKNLKLDGDKKTQFEAIYKRYQEELAATRQQQARQRDDDNNKNLSDLRPSGRTDPAAAASFGHPAEVLCRTVSDSHSAAVVTGLPAARPAGWPSGTRRSWRLRWRSSWRRLRRWR